MPHGKNGQNRKFIDMTIILRTGATIADLAWAAGLFEGEGCISHNKIAPRASISMSDEDVVRRFHRLIGMGSVAATPRKKEGYKDLWTWTVAGYKSTQYVMALLWQWLGVRRKARTEEILKQFQNGPVRKRRVCLRGHSLLDTKNIYVHISKGGRKVRHCKECRRINHHLRKGKSNAHE